MRRPKKTYWKKKRAAAESAAVDAAAGSAAVDAAAESARDVAAAEKEKEQHEERQEATSDESMEDAARDDVNKQRCAADHALLFYATISIILTIVRPPLLQQAPLGRQGRTSEARCNLCCESPTEKEGADAKKAATYRKKKRAARRLCAGSCGPARASLWLVCECGHRNSGEPTSARASMLIS